jgi:gamma-glutamylaminecyclotransferase
VFKLKLCYDSGKGTRIMAKLFVYGTLKQGFHAHFLLKKAPAALYGEIRTRPEYHLYDVGSFPGLILDVASQGGVTGELYEVPQSAFKDLDRYECVGTGLFKREIIELEDGTKAYAYLFNSDLENASKVESGRWDIKENES